MSSGKTVMIKLVRFVLIAVACLLLGILGYMVRGRMNPEPRKRVDVFVPDKPYSNAEAVTPDGRMVQGSSYRKRVAVFVPFKPNSQAEAVTPDEGMVQGSSQPITADKYALLIGVTTYDSSLISDRRLRYPENDAKAVADLLKQGGYSVKELLGENATKAAIEAALTTFSKEGGANGAVVIGLFGLGVQYDERAYFCPYDASIKTITYGTGDAQNRGHLVHELDVEKLVSLSAVLDAFALSKVKNKILLADCCHEDPSATLGRSTFGSSLTNADLPQGTAALFACSRNEQSYENYDWKQGAFTRAFLDQVPPVAAQGRVIVGDLAKKIQESVEAMVQEKTGKLQTVNYLSSSVVDLQWMLPESSSANVVASQSAPQGDPPSQSPPTSPEGDLITNSIGMKLKLIPAGEFLMGSPADEPDRDDAESPRHKVRMTQPYYMGVTEVTQGQWTAVMDTEPWVGEFGLRDNVKEGENYPATGMDWDDAVEYCEELSALEGRQYRLPTEAEWEYACRGGTTTAYSFGADISELKNYAWFRDNTVSVGEEYAHEVGAKLPNPFGLYDMHGNVCEWCSDRLGRYSPGAVKDPVGPPSPDDRLIRGGSWGRFDFCCRSAFRNEFSLLVVFGQTGFRVVLSP